MQNKAVVLVVFLLSFYNLLAAPKTPVLIFPPDKAENQPCQMIFQWQSTNGASSYTLQVSTNNSFKNLIVNQSGITDTTYKTIGLKASSAYYWRLNAASSLGTSKWSNSRSFTIGAAPARPVLIFPAADAKEQMTLLALNWNIVPGALSYAVQVAEDTSFSTCTYVKKGLITCPEQIPELKWATAYYWRVNAVNNYGVSEWSIIRKFVTKDFKCGLSTVTYGGKDYHTVSIGNQCWLKENLNVGSMISLENNPANNDKIEKYCYWNNSAECERYGAYYTWGEAMQYSTKEGAQGICPSGWHIPTRNEFNTLATSVNESGNDLKEIGQGYSEVGTNKSGFSALLAGSRGAKTNFGLPGFNPPGFATLFWSSTQHDASGADCLALTMDKRGISFNFRDNIFSGYSVRCIMN